MNKIKPGYKETKIGLIPEDWGIDVLGNKIDCYSGGTPSRSNDNYFNGSIPWIKSGELNNKYIFKTEECISEDAVNDSSAKFIEPETLLYALYGATAGIPAFSKIKATINQAILAIITDNDLYNVYLYFWLLHNKNDLLNVYTQGAQPNLSAQIVKDYVIPLPPLPEQKKIAEILSTWDRAIEKTEKLIVAKNKLKKGLMQQLLTGRKRFKEFGSGLDEVGSHETYEKSILEGWNWIHLNEIASVINRKNYKNNDRVLTVSGQFGLIDQNEFFKRKIASDNIENYYLLKKGEFAYNRSAMNGYPYGAIKRLDLYSKGALSILYLCFALEEEKINSDFFKHYCESGILNNQLMSIAHVGARAHGLLNVNTHEFMALKIKFPGMSEQIKISQVLNSIDNEISVLNKKLNAIKQQKKGLMQKLLTGQVRVKV